jgi:hypothetical protein
LGPFTSYGIAERYKNGASNWTQNEELTSICEKAKAEFQQKYPTARE